MVSGMTRIVALNCMFDRIKGRYIHVESFKWKQLTLYRLQNDEMIVASKCDQMSE